MIKLKYKIYFIINWRVKSKRKINLVKGPKKIKRMRVKIDIININNVLIEWWN
jgi:hypothetical protein